MDKSERETVATRVLELSRADQTEVLIATGDSTLTRFSRGISNQNVAANDTSLSVRAILGNRTGVVTTNDFGEASLRQAVSRAVELAKLSPVDPGQPLLPLGGSLRAPEGSYVTATAHSGPNRRARMCEEILGEADRAHYWCAGYVSATSVGYTFTNSSGTLASFDGTKAGVNVKMTAADSTGFAEAYASDIGRIDAAAIGRRAVHKAQASASPRSVDPGTWTVVLEPAAFGELISYVAHHFSAQAYDEGSSFFAGRLDTSFFPENVGISDDYAHPLAPWMPFDFEGAPKTRLALVEQGVVRNVVTDSYYANKLRRPNTGHALPAPNAWGPQATNLVVAPGRSSAEELIASTERGLLVTRFWYIRTVDQKQAIVTGMTRDGTFLIEKGKLTSGVKNMRFNQNILEALRRATFASDPTRTGGHSYSLVVPTVKIEGFTFTSGTEF